MFEFLPHTPLIVIYNLAFVLSINGLPLVWEPGGNLLVEPLLCTLPMPGSDGTRYGRVRVQTL